MVVPLGDGCGGCGGCGCSIFNRALSIIALLPSLPSPSALHTAQRKCTPYLKAKATGIHEPHL